ncbi:MAG: hypothetical protein QGG20_07915, partial [Dehalococcoidia bacterium]|nr:hypothetical protein [Dehalococcoidia bacterium]
GDRSSGARLIYHPAGFVIMVTLTICKPVHRGAPEVGQDTVEILTEFGLDRHEITRPKQSGAIATGDED